MALKIQRMQIEDLGSVRRLFEMMIIETLTHDYPIFDSEEVDNFCIQLHRQLTQNHYFAAWTAVRGHKVVGFLTAEVQERSVGKPNIYIFVHWLYVHPKHRGRGVARKLTAAGLEWSATCFHYPLTHIEVFAQPGDDQWVRRGFTPDITKYVLPIDKVSQLFAMKDDGKVPMRIVR